MNNHHVDGEHAIRIGGILRAARENLGIPIDQVAQHLRVRRALILAIEGGILHELPKYPYIQGHWRAYAELVGIRLAVTALPRQPQAASDLVGIADADDGESADPSAHGEKVKIRHRMLALGKSKYQKIFLVICTIILFSYVYSDWVAIEVRTDGVMAADGDTAAPSVDHTNDAREMRRVTFDADGAGGGGAAASPSGQSAASTNQQPSLSPATGDSLAGLSERPEGGEAGQVRPGGPANPTANVISLSSRGDVWVQVIDSLSGRSTIARTMRAGDTAEFQAAQGMRITIGAPQNIIIRLNDRQLIIDQFIEKGSIRNLSISQLLRVSELR